MRKFILFFVLILIISILSGCMTNQSVYIRKFSLTWLPDNTQFDLYQSGENHVALFSDSEKRLERYLYLDEYGKILWEKNFPVQEVLSSDGLTVTYSKNKEHLDIIRLDESGNEVWKLENIDKTSFRFVDQFLFFSNRLIKLNDNQEIEWNIEFNNRLEHISVEEEKTFIYSFMFENNSFRRFITIIDRDGQIKFNIESENGIFNYSKTDDGFYFTSNSNLIKYDNNGNKMFEKKVDFNTLFHIDYYIYNSNSDTDYCYIQQIDPSGAIKEIKQDRGKTTKVSLCNTYVYQDYIILETGNYLISYDKELNLMNQIGPYDSIYKTNHQSDSSMIFNVYQDEESSYLKVDYQGQKIWDKVFDKKLLYKSLRNIILHGVEDSLYTYNYYYTEDKYGNLYFITNDEEMLKDSIYKYDVTSQTKLLVSEFDPILRIQMLDNNQLLLIHRLTGSNHYYLTFMNQKGETLSTYKIYQSYELKDQQQAFIVRDKDNKSLKLTIRQYNQGIYYSNVKWDHYLNT